MKNTKKFLQALFLGVIFLIGFNVTHADLLNVNLTIRDGDTIIFSSLVPLQPTGTINLNDSSGISHSLEANSVLSLLNDADQLSPDFSISNLIYYDSYSSFYLKCINGTATSEKCDNWQYAVNDINPALGMDKNILSGGENVYLYFGQNHKITLSSNSIKTTDSLTATTENYHYQDNTWIPLAGVTVGITQADPSNPWTPIEIQTVLVDTDGKATFSEIPIGTYNAGIKEDFYFPTETLEVTTPPAIISSGGGGGVWYPPAPIVKPVFDLKKAFEYLSSQQKENGSFGEDLYTDWVAISLGSIENQNIKINSIAKLIKYLGDFKIEEMSLTDYERHSMALMALGLNPYNINNKNYIQKITDSFDGKQFGDKEMINDDIFALIVLQNAGFTQDEEIIKNTINFILSEQKENGSWNNSIDMTAAAVQAIPHFAGENFLLQGVSQADGPRASVWSATPDSDPGKEELSPAKINNTLLKAKEYLKQNQKDDGGFGNISSTAWAIQGILSLKEKPEDWKRTENTPFDYLAINQDTDGGIKNTDIESKIWETSYVLTSLSGKTWNQIMQKFDKIKIEVRPTEPNTLEISSPKKSESTIGKPEIKKVNKIKKIEIKKENIASPIVIDSETTKSTTETKKENWWRILANIIFGF